MWIFVAQGALAEKWLEKRFGYVTGREALRPEPENRRRSR